jgi:hypothetical protein
MKFDLYVGDQTISCEELKVSLYKDLLKSTYGDEPDLKRFIETVCEVFSSLTNKPYSFFENLSIIELMSCIFQLRMLSIGDRTNVSLNIDDVKRSLELRLDWVNEDLLSFNKTVKRLLTIGSVSIQMNSPSAKRLIESTDEEYLYFIKSIKIQDRLLEIETNEEAKNVIEKLPVKVALIVIDYYREFTNNLKNLNFLNRYMIKDHTLGFTPSVGSLLWFTKLIFNESLQAFYDNIFYLAKLSNIPPTFIQECPVGEYYVYVGILQRSLAQQSRAENNSALINQTDEDVLDEL